MTKSSKLQITDSVSQFEPFVRSIRFPRFKNLEDNTTIVFDHPITVLVGANGTNKTSILRALEGCPDYRNFGNFWFSTSLDPIDEATRHRFVHSYRTPSGKLVESRKMRITKEGNPDYFEPARPAEADGMELMQLLQETAESDKEFRTKTRWKAIKKEVVYLDFRHDIPAYDLHFHFNIRNRNNSSQGKKSTVRRQSKHIWSALENLERSHELHGRNRILERTVELNKEHLDWIGKILGRKYTRIRIVKHDFYNFEGHTISMETSGFKYSEAFAGSGEYAAVMLVKSILDAQPASLIILDEPEVSLHPGAQHALMDFIVHQSENKNHQIVISTHSPEIVRNLSPASIKVLVQNKMTGKVGLSGQSCLPDEAFLRIGVPTSGHTIYVEDELAKRVVEKAIAPLSRTYTDHITIEPVGGEDQIKNRLVPSIVEMHVRALVYLDGDQAAPEGIPDVATIVEADIVDTLEGLGIRKKSLGLSGGNAPNNAQAIKRARNILSWAKNNLKFLPTNGNPEQLLLTLIGETPPADGKEAKAVWVSRASLSLGYEDREASAAEVLIVQRQALAGVSNDSAELQSIRETVRNYVEGNREAS